MEVVLVLVGKIFINLTIIFTIFRKIYLMIVIRKTPTTKLIKGARYTVQNLWNGPNNPKWRQGKIRLVGMGVYDVRGFTDINGNPLPSINYQNPNIQETSPLEGKDISDGDILVCLSDRYRTLTKGSMYKVEKVIKEEIGGTYPRVEYYIKFEIINRKIKFWSWNFRKLTTQEIRDLSISSILGEKNKIVNDPNIKKIDLVPNKDKLLIQLLQKLYLMTKDISYHHLIGVVRKLPKTGNLVPMILMG